MNPMSIWNTCPGRIFSDVELMLSWVDCDMLEMGVCSVVVLILFVTSVSVTAHLIAFTNMHAPHLNSGGFCKRGTPSTYYVSPA